MDQARPLPKQHIGASLLRDVFTQVTVRTPNKYFTIRMQMSDDIDANRRSYDPISTGFHSSTCIGINHHCTLRMGITKGREFISRAAQIERAFSLQIWHQYRLLHTQYLC